MLILLFFSLDYFLSPINLNSKFNKKKGVERNIVYAHVYKENLYPKIKSKIKILKIDLFTDCKDRMKSLLLWI